MDDDVHADLHTHSRCSDGTLAPEALVTLAVERGVQVLAVTDHDTVNGVTRARATAREEGVDFVSGVELSVTVDQTEIHILAYGVDPMDSALLDHLRWMRDARRGRVRRILDRLRKQDVPLDDRALATKIESASSVGRPHVAAALVRAGHVETVEEAFDEYLGRGQPGYVDKPEVPADEALALVHGAGGVGVLAHPGHWTSGRRIRRLVAAGLDGIETIHPTHDASLRGYYERLAEGYGLLRTGGSDYHGRSEDEETLGSVGMSRTEWERFREAAL